MSTGINDITFTGDYDAMALSDAIIATGLTYGPGQRFYGVTSGTGGNGMPAFATVHLPDDATPQEISTVNSAVAAYDPLPAAKSNAISRVALDCADYINRHYDSSTQAALNAMLTQAALQSFANRAGYVGQALAWIETITAALFSTEDQINAATSVAAVNAITWNFSSQFDSTDPLVTIRAAQSLTN